MAGTPGSAAGLTYDPAADAAARYADWRVCRVRLGWGIREAMSRRDKVILLEVDSPPAEQRCSLAHAIAHLDLEHGIVPSGFFDQRQEAEANVLAARRLIALDALADALRWASDPAEVAAELDVDDATLVVRWRGLSDDERDYLARGLDRALDAA